MEPKNIITVIILIVAASSFFSVTACNNGPQPVSAANVAGNPQPDSTARIDTIKAKAPLGKDPCGGTRGTGQIVGIGDSTITIKKNDGVNETIRLTAKTIIKNAAGPLAKAGLKMGDRVTVVVMDRRIATAVLACNETVPGK